MNVRTATIASPTKRKRHKWPADKTTRTEWYTIRQCSVCGLERITDHNGKYPVVYYRAPHPAGREILREMPECEIVE